MIFTLFLLFLVLGSVVIGIGFWKKSFTIVVLGSIIFMSLGGLLMSEGLDIIGGVNIDTGAYLYDNYSYSDPTINVLGSMFFYGSFIPIILSFGLLVSESKNSKGEAVG